MPDSYGKRQRNTQKARKFAAREERRAARKQQKADEAAGIVRPRFDEDGNPILEPQTEGVEPEDGTAAVDEPAAEPAPEPVARQD